MTTTPDGKTIVRMTTPAQIVASVPPMLGYLPSESLVVMCLHAPNGRLGLIMRFDLPHPTDSLHLFAAEVADRVAVEQATGVVLVIYTAEPNLQGTKIYPQQPLALALLNALQQVSVIECALVREGLFFSYLCDQPCCPPGGTPLDVVAEDDQLQVLKAATRPVLASRDELAASLAGPSDERADFMRSLIESIDAVPTPDTWTDLNPLSLSDERAAQMAAGLLVSAEFRDKLGMREDAVRLLPLLAELCRRIPTPYDAPVCTLYAWVAYQAGGGSDVAITLKRALTTDPDYRLAVLLLEALRAQVPPDRLKVTS